MDKEIKPPFLRTPFNYDRNKASDDSGLHCKDPSLTQQQFKEESDINTIVERFHLTGEVPTVLDLPSDQDYEGIFDFQTAMNVVVHARETFMTLPAKIRTRFHNDPQEFLDFCGDPENKPEALKMGLLKDPATPLPGELTASRPETQDKPKGKQKGTTAPKPPTGTPSDPDEEP